MRNSPVCWRIARRRRGVRLPRDDPLWGKSPRGRAMSAPLSIANDEALLRQVETLLRYSGLISFCEPPEAIRQLALSVVQEIERHLSHPN